MCDADYFVRMKRAIGRKTSEALRLEASKAGAPSVFVFGRGRNRVEVSDAEAIGRRSAGENSGGALLEHLKASGRQ